MEVDEGGSGSGIGGEPSKNPTTATSTLASPDQMTSGLSVSLHPLVIMNISEHWTRTKAQHQQPSGNGIPPVLGAIIGKQQGRNIEIVNSFELVHDAEKNIVDRDYYAHKEGQFKQVRRTLYLKL